MKKDALIFFLIGIFSLSFSDYKNRKSFPTDVFFPPEKDEVIELLLPEATEFLSPKGMKSNSSQFLKFGKSKYHHAMKDLILPGFVSDEWLDPSCELTGGVKGEELYFTREGLVCEVLKDTLEVNVKYSIIRKAKKSFSGSGFLYYNIATVQLNSFVGKGAYANISIISSRSEIKEGDSLVPYISFDRKITITDHSKTYLDAPGEVISFGEEGRAVAGTGDFIFINKGSDNGVVKGRVLAIHRTNRWEKSFSSPDRYVVDDVFLVGQILMVDVGTFGSVGYILLGNDEVYLEDLVGSDWNAGFYQKVKEDDDSLEKDNFEENEFGNESNNFNSKQSMNQNFNNQNSSSQNLNSGDLNENEFDQDWDE